MVLSCYHSVLMSLPQIWMCGGQLLIIPCSRVGHIFRKRRPYGSPGGQDTMAHNSLRLANVWMDEYKVHTCTNAYSRLLECPLTSLPFSLWSNQEQYLSLRPELRNRSYGDISDRVALRKRLQCHSFRWYLDTVYPEMQTVSNGNKQQPVFINKGLKRPKVLQRGRVPELSLPCTPVSCTHLSLLLSHSFCLSYFSSVT